MESTIQERLHSLRELLKSNHIQAYIVPSTDPHLSEYVAAHWKSRAWISGFTGSAGTVVVTETEAGLWTDSRYFLQASQQLEGTGITLYKEMLPQTPSIPTFLHTHLEPGSTVGIDGKMFSIIQVEEMKKALEAHNIQLVSVGDLFSDIWTDRPELPIQPAFIYPEKYAGDSYLMKVEKIRNELIQLQKKALFVSSLDEIAWTLNLRGEDIHCNPVVVSYLLIGQDKTTFFIDPQKISDEVKHYLEDNRIECIPYHETESYLKTVTYSSILLDPKKTNYSIFSAISHSCQISFGESPVAILKAIRNKTEISGIHTAMQKDGVALVKFLKWLEESVPSGQETELSIEKKLHDFRAEQPLYIGESFDTIAAYGSHGAIVHYSANEESNVTLQPKSFLLLDSGAQYLDGTTDITRTIALGELTEEEKVDYTLILKGHIALAQAKFPAGTRGAQLDVLARMPIWQQGMNYLHGTGHGIGHFLNVHEGPQSIRMNENPVVLMPGMLTSNEPGVYKSDKHGIRIENLILVCEDREGMFGDYYRFETVTLCPLCKKGIIKEMLNPDEIDWLNSYHQKVYNQLSPCLNDEEKVWLEKATAAL